LIGPQGSILLLHFLPLIHYAHLGSQRKNLLGVSSWNPNDKPHRVPGDPDRNISHICGSKTRPPTDRVTSPYGAHMGLTYQFSISYHISTHSTSCQRHPNQLISTANPLATPALHSRSRLCENSHYEIPRIRNFTTKNRPFAWVVTRPRNR